MIEYLVKVMYRGARTVRVMAMNENLAKRYAQDGKGEVVEQQYENLSATSCKPENPEDKEA